MLHWYAENMPSGTLKVLYMRCLVAAGQWVCLDEGENNTQCNRNVTPGNFARDKCAARWDIGHSSDPQPANLWTVWWIVEMVYL